MNKQRKHFGIAYDALDENIYVFGGCSGQDTTLPIQVCGKYSVKKDQWNKIAPMRKSKSGVSACIMNNN